MTETWKPGDNVRTEKPLDTTGIICRFFVAESSGVEFADLQCLKTGIHYFVKVSELPTRQKQTAGSKNEGGREGEIMHSVTDIKPAYEDMSRAAWNRYLELEKEYAEEFNTVRSNSKGYELMSNLRKRAMREVDHPKPSHPFDRGYAPDLNYLG